MKRKAFCSTAGLSGHWYSHFTNGLWLFSKVKQVFPLKSLDVFEHEKTYKRRFMSLLLKIATTKNNLKIYHY